MGDKDNSSAKSPTRKTEEVTEKAQSQKEHANRNGVQGWISWMTAKKPSADRKAEPSTPATGKDGISTHGISKEKPETHKRKTSGRWSTFFGKWGGNKTLPTKPRPAPTLKATPTRKTPTNSTVQVATPPYSPPVAFDEIRLDQLAIHSQRAEFQVELERLMGIFRDSKEAKKRAETKLKIDTLQGIVDDMVLYREPPANKEGHEYTIWLMQRLKQTMMPSGGYISAAIYVPQIVWMQDGCKLVRYHLKMDTCNQLLKYLVEIEADFTFHANAISRLSKRLTVFQTQLERMHDTLAYQLWEVKGKEQDQTSHKSRLGKIGSAIAKRTARLRNYALPTKISKKESKALVTVLSAIFQKANFLNDLLVKYESDKAICTTVHKVLNFLRKGICTFVLHDLMKLMARYRTQCASSFTD
jgi:hypothetical protein